MLSINDYLCESDAYFLLGKYKPSENFDHEKKVLEISLYFFDILISAFSNPYENRSLLTYSALCHDLGYFINKKNHHLHSSYIIQNDKLLQKLPTELKLPLALICENHRKLSPYGLDIFSLEDQQILLKLIAILRISDALSNPVVNDISLSTTTSKLNISFATLPSDSYLTKLNTKASLFKSTFNTVLNLY